MSKQTDYIQRVTVSDGNGNVKDLVVVTPEVFEKMAKSMRKNFRFLDDRIVLATTKGVENARPEFEIADNWTADNRYNNEIESGESLPTLFGKIKRWLYNLSKLAFTGSWGDINNKPSTFTPSVHSHDWSEINNKPTTYPPSIHSHSWSSITGKPSTYPPSSHIHSMQDLSQTVGASEKDLVGHFSDSKVAKMILTFRADKEHASFDEWYNLRYCTSISTNLDPYVIVLMSPTGTEDEIAATAMISEGSFADPMSVDTYMANLSLMDICNASEVTHVSGSPITSVWGLSGNTRVALVRWYQEMESTDYAISTQITLMGAVDSWNEVQSAKVVVGYNTDTGYRNVLHFEGMNYWESALEWSDGSGNSSNLYAVINNSSVEFRTNTSSGKDPIEIPNQNSGPNLNFGLYSMDIWDLSGGTLAKIVPVVKFHTEPSTAGGRTQHVTFLRDSCQNVIVESQGYGGLWSGSSEIPFYYWVSNGTLSWTEKGKVCASFSKPSTSECMDGNVYMQSWDVTFGTTTDSEDFTLDFYEGFII